MLISGASVAPLVVGIGGCSSSGKSSIARCLVGRLPGCSTAVHLDDYYLREGDPRLPPVIPELGMHNWDHPSAFDLDRAVRDVEAFAADSTLKLVVVEGIVLYERDALVDILDKRFFLTLTRETCVERRRHRTFPGLPDTPAFFDVVVWPGYQRALELAKRANGTIFLDSAENDLVFLEREIWRELAGHLKLGTGQS